MVQDVLTANGRPHLATLASRVMGHVVRASVGNRVVLERELDRRFEAGAFTERGECADRDDGCLRD